MSRRATADVELSVGDKRKIMDACLRLGYSKHTCYQYTSGLKIVTFKLPWELVAALDRLARRKGMSRSELIREAVIRLLEEEGEL